MGYGGVLHLLEQFRVEQHGHELRTIKDRLIDRATVCVGQPPLHNVPQDLRVLPVEGIGQRLLPGMRLRVEPAMATDAIAMLARLGFS
jgi:hypothetical protein